MTCNSESCNKLYWNIAFGLDTTATNCTLTTQMSAGRVGSLTDLTTPAGGSWPVVAIDVALTDDAGLSCGRHPLAGPGTPVATTYSDPAAPVTFTASFDGTAFETRGLGGVVADGLRLLIDPSRTESVTAGSDTAYDLSGNDFHGIFRNPTGTPTPLGTMDSSLRLDTSGVPPAALDFVGTGDASQGYLQFATHPLGGYGAYTVESWFQVASLTPVGQYNVIFYSSAPDSSFQEFGVIAQDSVGDPGVAYEVNNDYTSGTSGVRLDAGWNHIVFAYDGDFGYLYVNGTLVRTRDFPNNNILPTSGWNWIGVGQWANSGYNGGHGFTQGKLGYLALYGRSLTATDVTQNFEAHRARFGL